MLCDLTKTLEKRLSNIGRKLIEIGNAHLPAIVDIDQYNNS